MATVYSLSLTQAITDALASHHRRDAYRTPTAFIRAILEEWLQANPPVQLSEKALAFLASQRAQLKQQYEDYGYRPDEVRTMLAEWEQKAIPSMAAAEKDLQRDALDSQGDS